MLSTRRARLTYLPIMLSAMAGLGWLAALVFRLALESGHGEAWLTAWVLAFVVALPTAMLLLAAFAAVGRNRPDRGIIPNAGVNIP